MGDEKYKIEYYEKENGECPVKEWEESLINKKGKRTELTQFESKIKILKKLGTYASKDTVPHLDGPIYELKPGNNRVFLAAISGYKILLLHPYRKKSQKCPPGEIKKAKEELADWKRRHNF